MKKLILFGLIMIWAVVAVIPIEANYDFTKIRTGTLYQRATVWADLVEMLKSQPTAKQVSFILEINGWSIASRSEPDSPRYLVSQLSREIVDEFDTRSFDKLIQGYQQLALIKNELVKNGEKFGGNEIDRHLYLPSWAVWSRYSHAVGEGDFDLAKRIWETFHQVAVDKLKELAKKTYINPDSIEYLESKTRYHFDQQQIDAMIRRSEKEPTEVKALYEKLGHDPERFEVEVWHTCRDCWARHLNRLVEKNQYSNFYVSQINQIALRYKLTDKQVSLTKQAGYAQAISQMDDNEFEIVSSILEKNLKNKF